MVGGDVAGRTAKVLAEKGREIAESRTQTSAESDEASAAHKQTAHYLTWRETVADWMAKPREGVGHRVVRPTQRDQW